MNIAIAGAGNVGTFIAADLVKAGHNVMVLEIDQEIVQREAARVPATFLHADACEYSALHDAGIETVDVMVAATGDDEDNLVISLLAKQEFGVPRVVARVNDPRNHWMFNETWGVDVAVSTPHLLSGVVEEAVSVGTLVRLFHLGDGSARLVEVTLADTSPAANQMVSALGIPRDATIVAVIRDRHVEVPRGDTVLAAGDEVVALVTSDTAEDQLKALLVG